MRATTGACGGSQLEGVEGARLFGVRMADAERIAKHLQHGLGCVIRFGNIEVTGNDDRQLRRAFGGSRQH